ncbi:unnamed protein product [Brugia pahangi]|uniref:Uncharacterized protein n=1 Tax=Brugia pahangi TaxID=6280 RepID=A0A0N4SXH1_BRUPA|nr:unnamed protein product [Brugia pahangi]
MPVFHTKTIEGILEPVAQQASSGMWMSQLGLPIPGRYFLIVLVIKGGSGRIKEFLD